MRLFTCCHILSCFLLAGCTVGPVYEPPVVDLPENWHNPTPANSENESPDDMIWWEAFQDPLLNQLMDLAIEQNLDLHAAAMRVLRARLEAKSKKADLYPHIDGSVNAGHIYYSKNALVDGLIGTVVPNKRCHIKRNVNFFEIGFDAEWEIDLFGMTAHEIAALKAQEEAVREDLCGIWVTLSAEIARNYIELRGLQQRSHIVSRSIEEQNAYVHLTQELYDRGLVNDSDLAMSQAEYCSLTAQLPLIEANMARAIHRLSILLGYAPGELEPVLLASESIPQLQCNLKIGVPSELLRRRPDIKKAERELAAATERIGVAVASLFPRFSLRGFIGEISTNIGSLFSPASATWLAGPQLLVPIFNSRLILQDIEYNKIATQEALYGYQKTVLEALEEAENAIAMVNAEKKRYSILSAALNSYQQATDSSKVLYERGLNDYLAVSSANKKFNDAEAALLQSNIDLLLQYISLYKALGGSWELEL